METAKSKCIRCGIALNFGTICASCDSKGGPDSLRDILGKLNALDNDDIGAEDFDPALVIGDLRDKVDAIKWRIDTWRAEAKTIEEQWIAQLEKKKCSLLRKAERLEEYVLYQMLEKGWETLPGNMVRIDIRKSTPSIEIDLDAGPESYLQYSNLVKQKTVWSWDKKAIKADLDKGVNYAFARIKQGQHIKWEIKK